MITFEISNRDLWKTQILQHCSRYSPFWDEYNVSTTPIGSPFVYSRIVSMAGRDREASRNSCMRRYISKDFLDHRCELLRGLDRAASAGGRGIWVGGGMREVGPCGDGRRHSFLICSLLRSSPSSAARTEARCGILDAKLLSLFVGTNLKK